MVARRKPPAPVPVKTAAKALLSTVPAEPETSKLTVAPRVSVAVLSAAMVFRPVMAIILHNRLVVIRRFIVLLVVMLGSFEPRFGFFRDKTVQYLGRFIIIKSGSSSF